jgi:hypothetical protein
MLPEYFEYMPDSLLRNAARYLEELVVKLDESSLGVSDRIIFFKDKTREDFYTATQEGDAKIDDTSGFKIENFFTYFQQASAYALSDGDQCFNVLDEGHLYSESGLEFDKDDVYYEHAKVFYYVFLIRRYHSDKACYLIASRSKMHKEAWVMCARGVNSWSGYFENEVRNNRGKYVPVSPILSTLADDRYFGKFSHQTMHSIMDEFKRITDPSIEYSSRNNYSALFKTTVQRDSWMADAHWYRNYIAHHILKWMENYYGYGEKLSLYRKMDGKNLNYIIGDEKHDACIQFFAGAWNNTNGYISEDFALNVTLHMTSVLHMPGFQGFTRFYGIGEINNLCEEWGHVSQDYENAKYLKGVRKVLKERSLQGGAGVESTRSGPTALDPETVKQKAARDDSYSVDETPLDPREFLTGLDDVAFNEIMLQNQRRHTVASCMRCGGYISTARTAAHLSTHLPASLDTKDRR